MTPACALTVHTDYGVRYVPLIGGILKTSPICNIDTYRFIIISLTSISLCYPLLLGINLWKGMLKKQLPTACSLYILHIDLIRNVMHNIHTLMYIHNGKPFHILTYILYTPWAYDTHIRLFLN